MDPFLKVVSNDGTDNTPFKLAAMRGYVTVVEEILSREGKKRRVK